MKRLYGLLASLLLLGMQCQAASIQDTVELDDGTEISIEVFPSDGKHLTLWLPSEFGLSPRQTPTAQGMAKQGMEVWIPDLHSAWFIPAGRYSLNDIAPAALTSLIKKAADTDKTVYLIASGRTAALALRSIRQFQLQHQQHSKHIGGLISFNPRLFVRTPQGGEAAEFLPIATASNTPVYMLQPQNSGGYWRTGKVVEQLSKGGSPVFTHRLENVSDGFNLRPEFSPEEEAMTARLPGIFAGAIKQLAAYAGTPAQAASMQGEDAQPERNNGSALLKPFPGKRMAPGLALATLEGKNIDLATLKDKVVLVNFWATWCPPCVEEIPSLQRLYAARKAQGLEILAVDVGEDKATMRKFLADKPIDFPVLMDIDGDALRDWGVHAFPTTLVVDRQQQIRYAVFGAFDWSSQEVLDTLDPLLAQ